MIANNTLIDILLKHAPETGNFSTKISGFSIVRRDTPHVIEQCMVNPIVLVTVQGKKRSIVGSVPYEYEAGQSLIFGIDLPTDSIVLDASPQKPYCSMLLELDASLIAAILTELSKEEFNDEQNLSAVACSKTDPFVLEAFCRLVQLLDTPEHIEYLAPLIIREIHYRLLTSLLGRHIRSIYFIGTQSNQIASAITWLEKNYKFPLKIELLSNHVNMARSTFHRVFKLITTLSPLQFQKKLRLFEARRLMLAEKKDVITAAQEVGYESTSQFSREYKRMFGNSPLKDVKNIFAKAR